jgi:glutamate dehydrogenase
MYFYKEIVLSDQLDDPYLEEVYYSYFPESFRKKYDITRVQHPLKKEIIGTVLVNRTINQAGITILPEIISIIDASPSSIIIAYTIIDRLFEMQALRMGIMKELRTANLRHAYELKIKLERLISDIIIWMLFSYKPGDLRFSLANNFDTFVKEYRTALDQSLDSDDNLVLENTCREYISLGISPELAKEIALLDFMRNSFEVILQAQKSELKLEDAVVLSQTIDRMFHFQVLHNRIMSIDLDSVWVKRHRGLLMQQLQVLKQQVSDTIVTRFEGKSDFDEKIAEFMKNNRQSFKQYQIEYNQIVNGEIVELSGIAILLDRIKQLII